ncbi:hypothetical protein RHECNPAF_112009 [Rhizobium etli CNPAF512]|nr:hypothetical protein RHECNPAF_112009 [Rhizobium etli CNPAF512]
MNLTLPLRQPPNKKGQEIARARYNRKLLTFGNIAQSQMEGGSPPPVMIVIGRDVQSSLGIWASTPVSCSLLRT